MLTFFIGDLLPIIVIMLLGYFREGANKFLI